MSAWPPGIPELPRARSVREVFVGLYTGHGVKRRLKKWSRPRISPQEIAILGTDDGAKDAGYSPWVVRLDGRIVYANMAARALGIIPPEDQA